MCEPAAEIKHRMRAWVSNQRFLIRNVDLIEILINHRPERAAPGYIELVNGSILLAQPVAELGCRRLRVREMPSIMAQFVVNLPAPHTRVISESFGKFRVNFRHVLAIQRRTPVCLFTAAMIHRASL